MSEFEDIGSALTFEDDLLDRHRFAQGVLRLVNNSNGPGVMALDSEWGTGKTYFLKMLQQLLEEKKHGVIYVDAFQSDLGGDAFATLVGEVLGAYDRWAIDSPEKRDKFKKSAIKVFKGLGRFTSGVLLKTAMAGMVDATQASAALEAAMEESSDRATAMLDHLLEQSSTKANTVQMFRDSLNALPSAFAKHKNDGTPTKLVFIIDELDRCRPNYAVDILEVVKHYFNVDNVFFIISGDFDLISKSIENAYGIPNMGRRYLQKIIPYYVSFANLSGQKLDRLRAEVSKRLRSETDQHADLANEAAGLLVELVRSERLSMRDLERIVQMGSTALALVGPRDFAPAPLVVALLVIRHQNHSLYRSVKNGFVTFAQIELHFNLSNLDESSARELKWLREYLLDFSDRYEMASANLYQDLSFRYNLPDRKLILQHLANNVIDIVWRDGV